MKKIDKEEKTLYNLKKSWRYVKKQKKKLFICLFLSLLLCLVSIASPLLKAKLLLSLTDSLFVQLINIALIILAFELFRNVCQYIYNHFFNKYLMETVSELQCEIANETLQLEIDEIDKKSSGVFIDRLNNDTREIVNIFAELGDAMIDVVTNIGVLIAVYFVNKVMFFYFLGTSILLFMLEKIRMKKYFEIDKKRRKINEKNTGLIGELVRGIRDIKVLNAGNVFMKKTKERLEESNAENYKMQKVNFTYNLIIGTLKDILDFTFVALGIYLMVNQKLTVAGMVIIYMYRNNIEYLLRYVTYVIELVKKFNVSAKRVFEVIENENFRKEKFGKVSLAKVNGDFEFKSVNFSYNNETQILKDISFKVKANETISFVGKSGSGKSTIFSLINKLYTANSGEILIDGIDINELDRDSIRNNMSIITQSPYIFNFSIRDNLKLVKEDMTDEEMIEVCQMACLNEFIETLPSKYDTLVGEGGVTLSGGQRQRLAIARALLKKTEIILFDEATSALDNNTQLEIQKAINNMKGKYTILIIAHRLSTVIGSDRIILVDDGKVLGEGTHNHLIENNETYRKLYEKELV